MRQLRVFLQDESGPTSVEYAVILMLIVLAATGAIQLVGAALFGSFDESLKQIEDAASGGGLN